MGRLLALVVADDGGFEGAGAEDGFGLGVAVAGDDGGDVLVAPLEEDLVTDEAGFDDLGIAGAEFADRQGGEGVGVGEDDAGLVEGAEEVLAVAGVDAGLAADGAVDLGEQGGGNLDEGQAAERGGGGEAGEVADHAAAEGEDGGAALDRGIQELVDEGGVGLDGFGGFTRGDDDRLVLDAGLVEAGVQGGQMEAGDGLVGDDDDALLGESFGEVGAGAGEQAGADDDVVLGRGQRHGEAAGRGPVFEGVENLGRGGVGGFVVAIDDEVGLGIDGVADLDELAEDLGRVAVGEERAVAARRDAADEGGERAAEPDGDASLADGVAGGAVHEGAAAGGKHDGVASEKAADDPALAVAEFGFAEAGEEFGDGAAGGELDFGVGVAEGQAEFGRRGGGRCWSCRRP